MFVVFDPFLWRTYASVTFLVCYGVVVLALTRFKYHQYEFECD